MYRKITSDLQNLKNPGKIDTYQRFFKTGKGEYGEGDVFLGIVVPEQRIVARRYLDTSILDLQRLLRSRIHEYRLVALLILIDQYKKADEKAKEKIFKVYLKNTKNINNWDLVDLSAPNIVGEHLLNKGKKILYTLARSKNLWEKRIAMLATYTFIRTNRYDDALKISEILLHDDHDLIHKAVGWMLREIGKRDQAVEEKFLKKHCKVMPRTMLRYAIERFPEKKRKTYMKK